MTYKIDVENKCINGYCDGIEELKQAIYKILLTERYRYIIYDWRYGVELESLFGESTDYVCAVIGGRIREALLQDNRVNDVKNFSFSVSRNSVRVYFTVDSVYGEADAEFEF